MGYHSTKQQEPSLSGSLQPTREKITEQYGKGYCNCRWSQGNVGECGISLGNHLGRASWRRLNRMGFSTATHSRTASWQKAWTLPQLPHWMHGDTKMPEEGAAAWLKCRRLWALRLSKITIWTTGKWLQMSGTPTYISFCSDKNMVMNGEWLLSRSKVLLRVIMRRQQATNRPIFKGGHMAFCLLVNSVETGFRQTWVQKHISTYQVWPCGVRFCHSQGNVIPKSMCTIVIRCLGFKVPRFSGEKYRTFQNMQRTLTTPPSENNPIKKCVTELIKHLVEEDIQLTSNIWKGGPHNTLSGKCKLKQQWDTTAHLEKWLKPGIITTNVEQPEFSFISQWEYKVIQPSWKTVWQLLVKLSIPWGAWMAQ